MDQDDSMKDLRDAFSKMAASFFKMAEAVGQAKKMFDQLIVQEYKAAGYPLGNSEEGLKKWMDRKKKTDGISHEAGQDKGMEALSAGLDREQQSYIDHTGLSIDIKKRVN